MIAFGQLEISVRMSESLGYRVERGGQKRDLRVVAPYADDFAAIGLDGGHAGWNRSFELSEPPQSTIYNKVRRTGKEALYAMESRKACKVPFGVTELKDGSPDRQLPASLGLRLAPVGLTKSAAGL